MNDITITTDTNNISVSQRSIDITTEEKVIQVNVTGGRGPAGEAPALTYIKYTALLTQSGTNAPVATILENNIDVSLFWERLTTGQYILKTPSFPTTGPFTVGKTFLFIGNTTFSASLMYANNNTSMDVPTNTGIVVHNKNSSFSFIDGFTNVSIEIRVYS